MSKSKATFSCYEQGAGKTLALTRRSFTYDADSSTLTMRVNIQFDFGVRGGVFVLVTDGFKSLKLLKERKK